MIEQFLVLIILLVLVKVAWNRGQTVDVDLLADYLRHDPNAYRLYDRLLLRFHRKPFSIVTIQTVAWGAMMFFTYALLQVTGTDLLLFLVGATVCAAQFKVRQALLYPLLVLFVQTQYGPLLVAIVATKELGLWIALGYLILSGGDLTSYIWVFVAGGVYFLLRYVITAKPRAPLVAPLFALPYWIMLLRQGGKQGTKRNFYVGVFWNLLGTFGMLSVILVKSLAGGLLLWAAIPIVLFAVWWEPQLWFPVLVVLLAGG